MSTGAVSSPMSNSDALRVRLIALNADLRSLRRTPGNEVEVEVELELDDSFAELLSELQSLRGDTATLRLQVAALQRGTETQRTEVSRAQQRHEHAMHSGLEQLRELEQALTLEREGNAQLTRALHDAHSRLTHLDISETQSHSHSPRTSEPKSLSSSHSSSSSDDMEPHAQDEPSTNPSPQPKDENDKEPVKETPDQSPAGGAAASATVVSAGSRPLPRRDYRLETTMEIRSNLDDAWLLRYAALHFETKLGAGVSSTVYKGTYEGKRVVAIKVLKLEKAQKDLKDFKKELFIMSQVHSPHVVEFYGATLEPKLCVVMALCPNGTLFHALSQPAAVPASLLNWDRALSWCVQISSGMATLHGWEPQIVHRDLKPLNLLLDEHFDVKICDFGLSRYTNSDQASDEMQTLTKLRGTYAYTAPEIYHKAQYSAKSDVYSIGVIFWELATRLVTGTYARPFAEFAELKYDYQIIYQTATQQLRPTFAPAFPAKFRQVVQACWTQEPERRPSALQLLEGLDIARKDWDKAQRKWPCL